MKTVSAILIVLLLGSTLSSCKQQSSEAPPPPPSKPNPEQQAKINQLESSLGQQAAAVKRWQTISLTLGAGCFVLLILGTALGTKTRHDSISS